METSHDSPTTHAIQSCRFLSPPGDAITRDDRRFAHLVAEGVTSWLDQVP